MLTLLFKNYRFIATNRKIYLTSHVAFEQKSRFMLTFLRVFADFRRRAGRPKRAS